MDYIYFLTTPASILDHIRNDGLFQIPVRDSDLCGCVFQLQSTLWMSSGLKISNLLFKDDRKTFKEFHES